MTTTALPPVTAPLGRRPVTGYALPLHPCPGACGVWTTQPGYCLTCLPPTPDTTDTEETA